jgi:hypothetical protein
MGKNQLEQLKYHKKKRDLILFFLLCIFFLVPVSFIVLALSGIDFDLLFLIYFPIFLATLWVLTKYRNKLTVHNMYYRYYQMLSDDMGLIKLPKRIFTSSWLTKMKESGYHQARELDDFMYFYQVVPKVRKHIIAKSVVLVSIIAKNEKLDFYSDVVDEEIKRIYENEKEANRSRTQIVLQFKKYQSFNQEVKDEIDKIINFKMGRNHLIHINIGYIVDQQAIYYLRPKRRYPNKYYYYATQLINEYCGIIK